MTPDSSHGCHGENTLFLNSDINKLLMILAWSLLFASMERELTCRDHHTRANTVQTFGHGTQHASTSSRCDVIAWLTLTREGGTGSL